ncbi:MAG: WbqC family protein [Candidatus Omnitrophica bacterium]|nr:WbqC family protein [Candidatus Omnitrophota bacterium]
MIVSIHQPQYLPWLGYFDKIAQSDLFILLDDVQFKKNEWQNRNRIRTNGDWQWLTVPVIHHFGQNIKQTAINNKVNWRDKQLKSLQLNYGKTPYFETYFPRFRSIIQQDRPFLSDLNIAVIQACLSILKIETQILISSAFKLQTDKTQRLIDLCQHVKADTYLSGTDGPNYMDMDLFAQHQINVMVQKYTHPRYPQGGNIKDSNFISHLSIIDLLFNCGANSLNILRNQS